MQRPQQKQNYIIIATVEYRVRSQIIKFNFGNSAFALGFTGFFSEAYLLEWSRLSKQKQR